MWAFRRNRAVADDGTGEINDRRLDDDFERMPSRDRAIPGSANELEVRGPSSSAVRTRRARFRRRICKGLVVAIGWGVFTPVAAIYFVWASLLAPIVLVAQVLATILLIQAERQIVLRAVLLMASSVAPWLVTYIAISTG
jgi:hypothetical protein